MHLPSFLWRPSRTKYSIDDILPNIQSKLASVQSCTEDNPENFRPSHLSALQTLTERYIDLEALKATPSKTLKGKAKVLDADVDAFQLDILNMLRDAWELSKMRTARISEAMAKARSHIDSIVLLLEDEYEVFRPMDTIEMHSLVRRYTDFYEQIRKSSEEVQASADTLNRDVADFLSTCQRTVSESLKAMDKAVSIELLGQSAQAKWSENPSFKGAYGEVYIAQLDERITIGTSNRSQSCVVTRVALKCVVEGLRFGLDAEKSEERYLKEANIWENLDHPNILPFLGRNTIGGQLFVAAPLAERGTLTSYVRRNPSAKFAPLLRDLASGLEYLHGKNIVHGDINGRNALVTRDLQIWICDFGCSKPENKDTSLGFKQAGSMWWKSPERISAEDTEHTRTKKDDVYALGVTISELFHRGEPFPTMSESQFEKDITNDSLKPRAVPGPLGIVSARCWAYEASDRPTMEEAEALLSKVVDGEGMD